MTHNIAFKTLGSLLFILVSGCISVLPETAPPAPRYAISDVTINTNATDTVAWSLVVDDPVAARIYDSVKVPLTRSENRFEFYANVEWADRAPELLQRALIRSFENTERILNIGDYASLPAADYILKTDLRALHVNYVAGSPSVVVSLFVRLTDSAGRIKAARLFDVEAAAGRDAVADVMAAFDRALTITQNDILEWSFAEISTLEAQNINTIAGTR